MVNQNQNTIMEREQFFILEKDFLAGRQVGDLIQSCGIEGLGAYMVILLYLRHQPRYRGCYTLSLLQRIEGRASGKEGSSRADCGRNVCAAWSGNGCAGALATCCD